jgi:hypothetical protein
MKYVALVCTALFLFGCKPSEKSSESPKARFEPKAATTTSSSAPAQPSERITSRSAEFGAIESDLTNLEREVTGLQARFQARTSPEALKLNEEITALNAKVAVLRSELTTAQPGDDATWNTRREKLKSELASYRGELETLSRRGEEIAS